MSDTVNLVLPKLVQNQAAAHTDFNTAMYKLDALALGSVKDYLVTPPTGVHGEVYLVQEHATGAWLNKNFNIAYYVVETSPDTIAEWRFIAPKDGMNVFVEDINQHYVFNGTDWQQVHLRSWSGHIKNVYNASTTHDFILTLGLPYAIRIVTISAQLEIGSPPSPPIPSCTVILRIDGTEDQTSKIAAKTMDDWLFHTLTGLTIDVPLNKKVQLRCKAILTDPHDLRYDVHYYRYPYA